MAVKGYDEDVQRRVWERSMRALGNVVSMLVSIGDDETLALASQASDEWQRLAAAAIRELDTKTDNLSVTSEPRSPSFPGAVEPEQSPLPPLREIAPEVRVAGSANGSRSPRYAASPSRRPTAKAAQRR